MMILFGQCENLKCNTYAEPTSPSRLDAESVLIENKLPVKFRLVTQVSVENEIEDGKQKRCAAEF